MPKFKKLVEKRPKDKYYYIRGTFTRDNLNFSENVLHFTDEGFLVGINSTVQVDVMLTQLTLIMI